MPSTQTISLPQIRVSDVDFFKPMTRATAVATAVTAADWDAGVKAIGNNIPGYRYSATFLSSLRSNLHLSASSPISPSSSLPATPTGPAFFAPPFPPAGAPPSPSPLSSAAASVASTSLSRSRKQAARAHISAAAAPAPSSSAAVPAAAAISHSRTTSRAKNNREYEFYDSNDPAVAFRVAPPSSADERSAALNLIAESIVEQRLVAVRAILSHPAVLAFVPMLLVIGARFLGYTTLLLVAVSVMATCLLGIYWFTQRFVTYARDIKMTWLGGNAPHASADGVSRIPPPSSHSSANGNGNGTGSSKSEDPTVLVATLPASSASSARSSSSPSSAGDPETEIIGALVFRYVKRERKAYIRAWTVARAHRGKGTGDGLLEEAVRMVWGRGCRGVEFERGHAHSHRVPLLTIPTTLPSLSSLSSLFTSTVRRTSVSNFPAHTARTPASAAIADGGGGSSINHNSDSGIDKTAAAAGAGALQIDFNAVFNRSDDRAREKLARVVGQVRREKGSR